MKVLYVVGVGAWGGGSRSLYEILGEHSMSVVQKYFLMVNGTMIPKFKPLAFDEVICRGFTRFDNSKISHYRGVRWLVTIREIFHFPFMLSAVYKAHKKWKKEEIELIHVNEIMEIIPGILAKRLFKAPLILHVRSVQNAKSTFMTRLMNKLITRHVDKVITIDENVRLSMAADLNTNVIHNSFSNDSSDKKDQELVQKLNSIEKKTLSVGFIGNLLKVKGLLDLVDAATLLGNDVKEVNFIIIGGEARAGKSLAERAAKLLGLNQNIKQDVEDRINQYNLSDSFHFLGATFDIRSAIEYFDVLCFPTHYNAPGRPVFEAAFFGVPSIVAVSDPKPDTVRHMETGIAIKPQSPAELSNAILYFLENKLEIGRMGKNALALATENFTSSTNAERLYQLYQNTLHNKLRTN